LSVIVNETPGSGIAAAAVSDDVSAETIVIDAAMLTVPPAAPVIERAAAMLDVIPIDAAISTSPAPLIAMVHAMLEVLVMLAARLT
jgi:hypothetical protein